MTIFTRSRRPSREPTPETYVPVVRRLSTMPASSSSRYARATVLGFTSSFSASARIGGNSSPAASRPDETRYFTWLTICR